MKIKGKSTVKYGSRTHPARPQGSSSSCAQPGDTQLPRPASEGQIPPLQKSSPGLLNDLASKEAAGLGKQKTMPQAKTKQEGAWKSFILRNHFSLNQFFASNIKFNAYFRKHDGKFLRSKFSVIWNS